MKHSQYDYQEKRDARWADDYYFAWSQKTGRIAFQGDLFIVTQ